MNFPMEKYINCFTRKNPGLIIFIVDQSESMNTLYEDGRSFAEVVSESVNKSILKLTSRFTSGTQIKDSVYVAIITHGGIENAQLHRIDKISQLINTPLRVEKYNKTISDGAGCMIELDFDIPIIIEPEAKGISNITKSFDIAYKIIQSWRDGFEYKSNCRDKCADPIPIVINFASEDIICDAELMQSTNRIKGIELDDGNPMILNCICANENHKDDFLLGNTDEIASYIPQEKIIGFKLSGYPNVDEQCKLTLYNIEKIPDVIDIIINYSKPCFSSQGKFIR